ncbi:MAG: NeuD/PglB/VioB family sugar acetyltransferase [Acidobacteria bacterium]|jgi:sugar O-acyltransferase (sialic acid O-acetyltransferase NeuD family)|nr:NeuD/PglB/VioB family sugar acetyltransferase [Acidobacteriota bacterium]
MTGPGTARPRLVLVGAGDHGRGTLEIVRARLAAGLDAPEPWGFVDDDASRHGATVGGLPVFGGADWLIARAAAAAAGGGAPPVALLALSGPKAKRVLDERLRAAGIAFATAVHPSAILGAGTTVGEGAVVGAGVVVAYDTAIGRHATINLNATVGHDCSLGDYATIAPGVNITGRVTLGEGVLIQTNATVVPGLTLGAWARIGPGAVVLKDVPAGEFWFGNPARRMPELG